MTSLRWHLLGAIAVLCLAQSGAHAQFNANYGGPGNEHGRAVHQLVNGPFAGNFVSVGEAPQFNNPAQTDIYVVMTNAAGAPLGPQFTIDITNGNDFGKDFVETANGTIVITGFFFAPVMTQSDIFALELDLATGAVLWSNDYSGNTPSGNFMDEAYHIEPVANGYVISGRSSSNHPNDTDAIAFKIGPTGDWRWGTAYDGGALSNDCFWTVAALPSGSLMAGGYTFANGADADVLLVELNSLGNEVFARHYNSPNNSNEGVRAVKACSALGPNANRVIVAGNTGFSLSMLGLVDVNTMGWINGNTYRVPGAGWTEAMGVFEAPAADNFAFVHAGLSFNAIAGRNYEFYISHVQNNLAMLGLPVDYYRVHGGALSDNGWAVDIATPVPGPDAYSVIATGVRATNAFAQQLDITRTTQLGLINTPGCDVQVAPTVTSITLTPTAMPSCQTLWGMLLDRLTPTVTPQNTPPIFCPGLNFNVREGRPGLDPDNTVNGGTQDALGMDTTYEAMHRGIDAGDAAGVKGTDGQGIAASAIPNPVKRGGTFTVAYNVASTAPAEVSVSDAAGRTVYQVTKEGHAGEAKVELSTAGWATGAYMVRIAIGGQTITRRVIVSD